MFSETIHTQKGRNVMEKLDYKKKFRELYQPSAKPALIDVPEMIFFAVGGAGDPNKCNTKRQWKFSTGCHSR